MNEIKKEVIIYEVVNGNITKLQMEGYVYQIENKTSTEKPLEKPKPEKESVKHDDNVKINTGKTIARMSGSMIYEYVLNDIKQALQNLNVSNKDIENIIRRYHPNVKDNTVDVYLRAYIRFIKNGEKVPPKNFRRRRRRKIPEGAVGFCTRYGTFIWRKDYNDVLKGLNYMEYGYKPSVQQISEKFKISEQRVRAVLNYMIEQEGRVTSDTTDGKGAPLYHFVKKEE